MLRPIKKRMTWNILPIELRVLILSMRYTLREEAQKTIVRTWKKFYAPKKIAHYLVERERWSMGGVWNDGVFGGDSMNVMFPETADIMEYCAKILSGRENPNYWNAVLKEVEHEMWMNQYSGGPGAEYMDRVNNAFEVLIKKFKYKSKWDEYESTRVMLTPISTAWLELTTSQGGNHWG